MSQPPGSSYESDMPRSWGLFASRVDANQPTDEEREAAEHLVRTGWFDRYASTYDRQKAREDFQNGMRYGFKDRTYAVNWDVWRSEYKGRNYPPGSFDPAPTVPPQPAGPSDPNKPNWMTDKQWSDELKRQQRRDQRKLREQLKNNKGEIGEKGRREDHPLYDPKLEKEIRKDRERRAPKEPKFYEPPAERFIRRERRKNWYKNNGGGNDGDVSE